MRVEILAKATGLDPLTVVDLIEKGWEFRGTTWRNPGRVLAEKQIKKAKRRKH